MEENNSDFQDRLLPGEHVFWTGRPGGGLMLTSRDTFLIPFSLLWGGFAIFWETSVLQSSAPIFFRLWGIPFVLVGLYFIAGRFFADAWIRGRLHYAVTDQRILIERKGISAAFTALPIDRLPSVTLVEKSNGRGTILFDQPQPFLGARGFGVWTPSASGPPQFALIDDSRTVYDKIQQLAEAKKRAIKPSGV
ncbi:MAG TPA: hypothetical protein VH000_06150 [Rhizomicrobium sp.]|jgi:hypothetical protein|nr:hypothetical protein [Rhizomicrobium sp.]